MEPISLVQAVGLAAVAGVGGWVGSYFGAYWKKKGEQTATHEDIENILRELRATTQATREIEARISGELWDKQKQWEMRRDVLFEIAKAAGASKDALARMHAIFLTDKENAAQGRAIRADKQAQAYEAVNRANGALEQAYMLGLVACGAEIRDRVERMALFSRGLALEIAEGKPESFLERSNELATNYSDLAKAIRAELGVPPVQLQKK